MEIGLVTTDAPGQDTNGLTDRELDHEPCLPAIPLAGQQQARPTQPNPRFGPLQFQGP